MRISLIRIPFTLSLEISKKHDLRHTLKRFEEIYEEAIRLKRAEIEAEAE